MDDCTNRPPLLIANVQGWPGVTAEQIYQELRIHCRFDVQQLRKNQFLLFSNKFKEYVIRLLAVDLSLQFFCFQLLPSWYSGIPFWINKRGLCCSHGSCRKFALSVQMLPSKRLCAWWHLDELGAPLWKGRTKALYLSFPVLSKYTPRGFWGRLNQTIHCSWEMRCWEL